MNIGLIESEIIKWIVLPFLIFSFRVMDVSLGTVRIVCISRGFRYLAFLTGFFEVLIWLYAMGIIMQNLQNGICFLAYGLGFATGTYAGMCIEEKLAIGNYIVRVITRKEASDLIENLRAGGFGATIMEAQGTQEKVHVVYITIKRQDFKKVTQIIKKYDPKTFFTVEDAKMVNGGVFPARHYLPLPLAFSHLSMYKFWRKGK